MVTGRTLLATAVPMTPLAYGRHVLAGCGVMQIVYQSCGCEVVGVCVASVPVGASQRASDPL